MFASLFDLDFTPYAPVLPWLQALSDMTMGLSWFAVAICLARLAIKRPEFARRPTMWLLGLGILALGIARFIDAGLFGLPNAASQGIIKALTAVASILIAALIWRVLPKQVAAANPVQSQHITERLDTEAVRHNHTVEQLHRAEESFDLFVESVRDCAMYVLDTAGTVTSWNAGAQFIKQYRTDEIVGRHFSCFYTADDQAAGKPADALATASRDGIYQEEGWRVRKDGSLFMADVVINPILDRQERLVGFAKMTRDITRRKQADADLEQARAALAQSQKMEAVGQLTGGIAHDFNNMLTAILGSLELLKTGKDEFTPATKRLLRVMQHASERGAHLIARLLTFSRKQTLAPAVTDVNRLVADMAELLRRTIGESVSIETRLGERLWMVFVDPNQLESALLNLAVNARDAMPRGGTLSIETGNTVLDENFARQHCNLSAGEYIFIAVKDNGSGMTQEVLQHAFDPFYTTKGVGRGTGLGLSQVYGFVKQSDGHIEVASAPGRGTTITMYFAHPDVMGVSEPPAVRPDAEPVPEGNETILIVDDDDDVRTFSTGAARYLGYTVLDAADAASALAMLNANQDIRLLFTDVGLPGMSGRDLATAALAQRPDLKIVFTSGYARTTIVRLGLFDRGVRLLPKPYRLLDLAQALRQGLDA